MWRSFFIFVLLLWLHPVAAQETLQCEGLPEARLVNGEQGEVLPGAPNNLRVEPSTDSDILTEIPAEELFYVVDGPECSDEYIWWQVAYDDYIGWTVENVDEEEYAVEPVSTTTSEVTFGGVTFTLDSRVAESATGQLIPPSDPNNTSLPFWQQTPMFINFALDGVFDNPGTMGEIAVYPAQPLGDVQQSTAIEDLRRILDSRQPNPTPAALPIVNAERVFVSQKKYIDFEGGTGLRFVVYFSQSADPLTSGSLWYVYQGLTRQGEHYVQFYLPLVTTLFPATIDDDFDFNAFISDYDQYLKDAQQTVDEGSPDDFAPTLLTLDNMVASLKIDPVAVSATFAGDVSLTVSCQITAISDTRLRTEPSVDSPITDYLEAGTKVAANGQFKRRGEDFPWWRLASNKGVGSIPGVSSLPGPRWIRADFTLEEGNCAGLPMVDAPR
jgi:uncharacterized protein YgiM (DUF1202 family)